MEIHQLEGIKDFILLTQETIRRKYLKLSFLLTFLMSIDEKMFPEKPFVVFSEDGEELFLYGLFPDADGNMGINEIFNFGNVVKLSALENENIGIIPVATTLKVYFECPSHQDPKSAHERNQFEAAERILFSEKPASVPMEVKIYASESMEIPLSLEEAKNRFPNHGDILECFLGIKTEVELRVVLKTTEKKDISLYAPFTSDGNTSMVKLLDLSDLSDELFAFEDFKRGKYVSFDHLRMLMQRSDIIPPFPMEKRVKFTEALRILTPAFTEFSKKAVA